MRIGAMNHPGHPVTGEISWIAAMGLDFIDLTLEPPLAASWKIDVDAVRDALQKSGLAIVGHTAFYLPLGSPFESIRRAAVEEAQRCLEIFGRLGASWMNIHPDAHIPLHDFHYAVERNLTSIRELLATSKETGVGLMLENLPGDLSTVDRLKPFLEPVPELGLHLDVGHANLGVRQNTTEELVAAFGKRLRHVHLHDNKGGSQDLHLPLGAGNLDLARAVRSLKSGGYDGTITLEVFSPDRQYLAHSRDVLRRLWDEAPT